MRGEEAFGEPQERIETRRLAREEGGKEGGSEGVREGAKVRWRSSTYSSRSTG